MEGKKTFNLTLQMPTKLITSSESLRFFDEKIYTAYFRSSFQIFDCLFANKLFYLVLIGPNNSRHQLKHRTVTYNCVMELDLHVFLLIRNLILSFDITKYQHPEFAFWYNLFPTSNLKCLQCINTNMLG